MAHDPHDAPTVAIGSDELARLGVVEPVDAPVAPAVDLDATAVATPVLDIASAPTTVVARDSTTDMVGVDDDATQLGMVPRAIAPRARAPVAVVRGSAPADPMATVPPDSLEGLAGDSMSGELTDRYEIGALLGTGTFGRVFRAVDRKLRRPVALKILHAHYGGEIRQRFLQEAHIASGIEHPGIVSVLDAGETKAGTAFIVMELLRGESLQARIDRSGRLPSATVLEIGRQVAAALAAAHAAGVIHRDLKPDNIFLVPDPAAALGERVKVFDFGLAKPRHSPLATGAASMFGTPAYMSPEQCQSSADIDQCADIYSLGCCLFHMAAGRPPFQGSILEIIKAHEAVIPPKLSTLVPDIDPQLDALVTRLLAKSRSQRPATMKYVERTLVGAKPAVDHGADTRTPARVPIPRSRWWRARLVPIVTAIIAGVLLVAAIAVLR